MDWLNENAQRSYPFVGGTVIDGYPRAIVDAIFTFGADIPFDFDRDDVDFVLASVTVDGLGHHLLFEYRVAGVPTGSPLLFTVPPGTPAHTVIGASSAASHGYVTIGEITTLPPGSYGSPVELRTLTVSVPAQATQVRVYNANRRGSYVPYAPPGHGLTPAQLYLQAKAAAPPWAPNQCLDVPVGTLTGDITLRGGFNVEVTANPAISTITVAMNTSKSGSGCGVVGYVKSKLGTSDPVADLDGDGVVTANDVALAELLPVAPLEITAQGVLRMINGSGVLRGDLKIIAGNGSRVETEQDQYAVFVYIDSMSVPEKCL